MTSNLKQSTPRISPNPKPETQGIGFSFPDPQGMTVCHSPIPQIPKEWKLLGNWHPYKQQWYDQNNCISYRIDDILVWIQYNHIPIILQYFRLNENECRSYCLRKCGWVELKSEFTFTQQSPPSKLQLALLVSILQ